MAVTIDITWTPIPIGIARGRLELLLLLAPRISFPGAPKRLDSVIGELEKKFLWPDRLPTQVEISFSGISAPVRFSTSPKTPHWPLFFPADLPVRSRSTQSPTTSKVEIAATFDVSSLGQEVSQVYKPKDVSVRGQRASQLIRKVNEARTRSDAKEIVNFEQYFSVSPKNIHLPLAKVREPQDFHDRVALASRWPKLAADLGLILRCDAPADDLLGANRQMKPGTMQVVLRDADLRAISIRPRVSYSSGFRLADVRENISDVDIDQGLLDLKNAQVIDLRDEGHSQAPSQGSKFSIACFDIEGAVFKWLGRSATFGEAVKALSTGLPDGALAGTGPLITPSADADYARQLMLATGEDPTALPALTTTGFAVVRNERKKGLRARVDRISKKWMDGQKYRRDGRSEDALDSNDLLRGFRLDVYESDSPQPGWRSLTRRETTIQVGGSSVVIDDEGWTDSAPLVEQETENGVKSKIHENLVSWSGWSLSARRPERTIETNDELNFRGSAAQGNEPRERIIAPYESGKGTLPALRYGRKYRLRVRTVDIAGNSLSLKEADDRGNDAASPELKFLRTNPVVPPVMVTASEHTEGESLERLAVRSNPLAQTYPDGREEPVPNPLHFPGADQTSALLKKLLTGLARVPGVESYGTVSERYFAPPQTAFSEAERHGKFDALIREKKLDDAFALASREAESLVPHSESKKLAADPLRARMARTASGKAKAGGVAERSFDRGSSLRKRGDAPESGEYVVLEKAPPAVPYLPDPLARGVAFGYDRALEAIGGRRFSTLLSPPSAREIPPQRFDLQTDFGGQWPDLGIWKLRLTAGKEKTAKWTSGADRRVVEVAVPPGRAVLVHYWSTLTEDAAATMALADGGSATLSKKGVDRRLTPARTLALVHATLQPLTTPVISATQLTRRESMGNIIDAETRSWLSFKLQQDEESTSSVDIVARWTEYVDDPTSDGLETPERRSVLTKVDTARSAYGVASLPDRVERTTYDWHDTKHRVLRLYGSATSAFRDYFPPEFTGDPEYFKADGKGVEEILHSTKQPPPPVVEDVVPVFSWKETRNSVVVRSREVGLKIFLRRPWFASGQGEQLALILGGSGAAINTSSPFSLVGRDPIRDPAGTPWRGAQLRAAQLSSPTSRPATGAGAETAQLFDVEWDAERKLWFVVVMIAADSYFDFARLVLARYQKYSHPQRDFSQRIFLDPISVPPKRTLTITKMDNGKQVQVKLEGPSQVAVIPLKVGPSPGVNGYPTPKMFADRLGSNIPIPRDANGKEDLSALGNVVVAFWEKAIDKDTWIPALTVPAQVLKPYDSGPTVLGTIDVPTGGTNRLVVQEYEFYWEDMARTKTAGRIVYSDAVVWP